MNLVLLLAVVLLLVLLIRTVLVRAPRYGRPFLLRLALITVALVVFGLAISGRLHWLFAVVGSLLPFAGRIIRGALPLLIRILPMLRSRSTRRRSQGQQSRVRSRILEMTLDHDTGNISGRVVDGPFTGASLDELSLPQLKLLYQQCQQEDMEGIKLLEAYIQRHRDQYWQANGKTDSGQQPGPQTSAMSEADALAILGLEPGADAAQIRAAHKRLMARLHPDKGGSNYLASKVNQAKEILLKQVDKQGI